MLYTFIMNLSTQPMPTHSIQIDDIQTTIYENLNDVCDTKNIDLNSQIFNLAFDLEPHPEHSLSLIKYQQEIEKVDDLLYRWTI